MAHKLPYLLGMGYLQGCIREVSIGQRLPF